MPGQEQQKIQGRNKQSILLYKMLPNIKL